MKKLLSTLLVLLSLGSLVANVQARPGPGGEGDPMRMIERLLGRLELSEEQELQLEELLAASEVSSAADQTRLRQLREQMHAQMDAFDEGKAQALADEIGQISGRLSYSRMSVMAQVRALLTDEQRDKMTQMQERRGQRGREGRPSKEQPSR